MMNDKSSLKVLLVRPPAPNLLSFTKILDNEPLELEYLAAALTAHGHRYHIHDGLIHPGGFEAALKAYRPDVLAITGYITQEKLMIDYCRLAKALFPKVYTILGGVHVQLNYMRLAAPEVDFLCRSEDVWAFAGLVDNLSLVNASSLTPRLSHPQGSSPLANWYEQLDALSGLVYRNAEGKWIAAPMAVPDIQQLPLPDRSFFNANMQHYRYLDLTPVATLKTAFSCPHTCNFCYCTLLAGGRYQTRDIDKVLDELETINAPNVQIVDDTFLVDPHRVTAFLDGLITRGIQKTFVCYARADDIVKHPELVARMSAQGFRYFLVGLEAIDTEQLDAYNKKTTADVNRRCAEVIKPLEPNTYLVALMIVSHEARESDFERLYQWVVRTGIHHVTVSIFTPIHGTPLYTQYQDAITSTDIVDWDFLHLVLEPTHLSRSAFYRAYFKLFMRLYRIAKRTGIYSFMDLDYYRRMLSSYLIRQFR